MWRRTSVANLWIAVKKWFEKSEEIAESVGSKILDTASSVKETVSEKAAEMVDKAKEVLDNPEESVDSAI